MNGVPNDPYDELDAADLRALVESAGALAAELEVAGLLDRILEQATRLTDSADGSLLLHDPAKQRLYFAAATGRNAPAVLERWGADSDSGVPLVGSKAGEVFRTGEPLVDQRVADDADHFKGVDLDTDHTTTSMVCVPLAAGAERLGVVQLLNKTTGRYGRRDVVLLEQFAAQAAVALRNIHLFEQLLAHMGLYGSRRKGVGPAELLEELNAPPRYEQLTVMFADMRGSTRLSQVVDRPEQAFTYLNEFLGLLATTVLDHDGVVNKFLGDGVMALFRGPGHSERAVVAAFDILTRFDDLKAGWDEASNTSLAFVDVGIGITTDSVLLGPVGIGRVRDFTVIGISVALAACLTDHAREGKSVLVDKRTFRQAKNAVVRHEGPYTVELRSPGQAAGRQFDCFSIHPSVDDIVPRRLPPRGDTHRSPADVFISYSHRDASWLARLRTHLKPVLRTGTISVWDDTQIRAGADWRSEIEQAVATAKVAVLLVTPEFLDSDFIAEHELPPLLDAARRDGKRILWVPLSASSYDRTEIERYQALSDPARPLDGLSDAEQNRALVDIAKRIADAV